MDSAFFGPQIIGIGVEKSESVHLWYTIVDFGRQKVLFGNRGKLVIKKIGGPRHSSHN